MRLEIKSLILMLTFLIGTVAVNVFRSVDLNSRMALTAALELVRPINSVDFYTDSPHADIVHEEEIPQPPAEFAGWYSFDSSTNLKDVILISIERYTASSDEQLELYAGVSTNFENYGDSGHVRMKWAKLEGNKIAFRTKMIKGFEFEFNGEFISNKFTGEENEKLLRGTLTQFRKNKRVAKTSGDLSYIEPRCWN